MSSCKGQVSSKKDETEESLWETLEDIQTIFEKELRDLKDISLSGVIQSNSEYNNGDHFEEEEVLIWNCGLCGSDYFKDQAHFRCHLLEHHSVVERRTNKRKDFYGCLSCGNGFPSLQVLEDHLHHEELCHKDYDKVLLALYQSHSVPRFFAPLHHRCRSCQDKFDQLYRLLQYFPNCSHLDNNNSRKRKLDNQGYRLLSNGREIGEKNGADSRRGIKSRGALETKVTYEDDYLHSDHSLSKEMVSLNGSDFLPCSTLENLIDQSILEGHALDALVSMKSVKASRHKRSKSRSPFEAEGLACYGFNGSQWLFSKPRRRANNKKEDREFNPALNVDGNYDDSQMEEVEVIHVVDEEGSNEEEIEVDDIQEGESVSSKGSTTMSCSGCNIHSFEAKSYFLYHELFIHFKTYCFPCDSIFENALLLESHNEKHHKSYPCGTCSESFQSREDLLNHSAHAHGSCPFCLEITSKEAIHLHFFKRHRLSLKGGIPDLRIITELSASSGTCAFCRKKKSLDGLLDHFIKVHGFTSNNLLGFLARSGFALDVRLSHERASLPEITTLRCKEEEDDTSYVLGFRGKSKANKFPAETPYDCPFPNCSSEEVNDHGLHLLVEHSLKYCLLCDAFFLRDSGLKDHDSLYHKDSYKCNYCQDAFDNAFSLMDHRSKSHEYFTCLLCRGLLITRKEDFSAHLREFHRVQKMEDIPAIYNRALASVSGAPKLIHCHLCECKDVPRKCGSLIKHLTSYHQLKALDLFFASYDGGSSSFNISSVPSFQAIELKEEYVYIGEGDVNVILESPSEVSGNNKVGLNNSEEEEEEQQGASSSTSSYRCDFCPLSTSSLSEMKHHLLKVHKSSILVSDEYSFKCTHCEESFWSLEERRRHIKAAHHSDQSSRKEEGREFTCTICNHTSPNKNALRRHFQRMHPTEALSSNVSYECDLCQMLFQWKSQLHEHIKEAHKARGENHCSNCSNYFKSPIGLKNHSKACLRKNKNKSSNSPEAPVGKETPENNVESTPHEVVSEKPSNASDPTESSDASPSDSSKKKDGDDALSEPSATQSSSYPKMRKLKCEFCAIVLESYKIREEHYLNVHEGRLPFICDVCDKGFSTKSSLINHKTKHGNFTCQFCSKEFLRRDSFNEHLLIHKGPRYPCPHCPKEFVQKSNLQRHIRIHLGIKPYKCKRCPKAFSDSAALKAHETVHEMIKLKCDLCAQTFARQQKLNYHLRIHTGDGLLTCDVCQKVFTNSYSMKRHLLTHSENKVISCAICSNVFPTRKKLSLHLKMKEKLGMECSKCGLLFHSEVELNTHILSFHQSESDQAKGYKCRHCDSSYNSLSDIREHLLLIHSIKQDISFHFINGFRNEQEGQMCQDSSVISNPSDAPKCNLCDETPENIMELGIHLKSAHGAPCNKNGAFSCPKCKSEIGPLVVEFNEHFLNCAKN